MAVTVKIPAQFRSLTGGASKVNVEAATLADMVEILEKQYPGMKSKFYKDEGGVRQSINFMVDGKEHRTLQGLETPIPDGAIVNVVYIAAGG